MDNNYYIYLNVEPYLKAWLESNFGEPVVLPKDSPENKTIVRFLELKGSRENEEVTDSESNLRILIQGTREKRPERFNYLPERAKKILISSLDGLFEQNLWQDFNHQRKLNKCSIIDFIYAWMEDYKIPFDAHETLRQRYYRLRRTYEKEGVYL